MKKFHHINHPILRHKLGLLRDKNTSTFEFRELVKEISKILAYEAMKDWDQFEMIDIETPIAKTKVEKIKNAPIAVSVMRAGNPVQEAVLSMLPFASAGHIGIYRDKFINNTVEYYFKLPENHVGKTILLCEPLLATADTSIAAVDRLKNYEVGKIKLLSILVSEKGLEKLHHFHPDVEVFALNMEKEINDKGYLVPGLGDAGDRIYGTK
jgi:uracil phosphoribosyltransferase